MRRKHEGLTLVELMVTLAAAIILVAVGMPFFGGVVANNRAAAQVNDLVMAINLARSEAIGRADDISVRPDGSDDWTDGWIVFVDADAAGDFDAGDDEVLRVWEAPSADSTVSLSAGTSLTFDLDGSPGITSPVGFDMDQTDATGLVRRCVVVSTIGQIRTIREDPDVAWSCP